MYPVWQRAIGNGGVTKAVLRLPREKEEARIAFPRRKGPAPAGQPAVLLALRKWQVYCFVSPLGARLDWPEEKTGFRVETSAKPLGSFGENPSRDDLALAARAAREVKAEAERMGASGTAAPVILLFHTDAPVRSVLLLLSALDRAGVGEVEIAESREQ